MSSDVARSAVRWTDAVFRDPRRAPSPHGAVLGVLPGEGIGPEVLDAALDVVSAALAATGAPALRVRTGGPIGRDAELLSGRALTDEVARFCEQTFADGGAVLCGPGGSRFVYDMRRRFDLFCKLSPLRPLEALSGAGRLRAEAVAGADVLVVRENCGGVYQGEWRETSGPEGRVAEHSFRYTEAQVRRFLEVAGRLAASRRGRLCVVVKDGGVPTVTGLWRDIGREIAERAGVEASFVDVDLCGYRLIQEPAAFDVVAAPNLFGDVLADLGAVLLGSRGMSFSGNFSSSGAAVYQTNHGSAHDLAGLGRANPLGQIGSAAMLLRESLGLPREAALVEDAVDEVLRMGYRTFDVAERGTTVVGTSELAERIAAQVERLARGGESNARVSRAAGAEPIALPE
jgi:3-isopropylmalate dehydrogenase